MATGDGGEVGECGREEQTNPRSGAAISRPQEFYDSKRKYDPGWFDRRRGSDDITRKTRRWFGKSVEETCVNGNAGVADRGVLGSAWLFEGDISSEGIRRRTDSLQKLPEAGGAAVNNANPRA